MVDRPRPARRPQDQPAGRRAARRQLRQRPGDRRAGARRSSRSTSTPRPQSPERARARRARRGRRRDRARATSCGSPTSRSAASVDALADELARLPAGGSRSHSGRPLAAAPPADAGAGCAPGSNAASDVDAVMTSLGKSLFWKDKANGRGGCFRSGRASDLAPVVERAGSARAQLDVQLRCPTARRLARSCSRSLARRAAV